MRRVTSWTVLGFGLTMAACGGPTNGDDIDDARAPLRASPTPPDPQPSPDPAPARPGRPAPSPSPSVSPAIPLFADLLLDGTATFYLTDALSATPGGAYRGLRIGVVNRGNANTNAEKGTIQFDKNYYSQVTVHASSGETFLQAGERGYLDAAVPAYAVAQCMTFSVLIDIDTNHRLQFQQDEHRVFDNDSGTVKTQCLTWESPLTAELIERSTIDAGLAGKSIQAMVNEVVPNPDGSYCSQCHAPAAFGVIYKFQPGTFIGPFDNVGGLTWGGPGGWAAIIYGNTEPKSAAFPKSYQMREAMGRWVANGSPYNKEQGLANSPSTVKSN